MGCVAGLGIAAYICKPEATCLDKLPPQRMKGFEKIVFSAMLSGLALDAALIASCVVIGILGVLQVYSIPMTLGGIFIGFGIGYCLIPTIICIFGALSTSINESCKAKKDEIPLTESGTLLTDM